MRRSLPITLVTGFLGAGRTSLLHHLISAQPEGHLAILVESSGPLELDGKALRGLCGSMRRQYDVVREVTADEQLSSILPELVREGRFDRILVEVSATTLASRWLRQLRPMADLTYVEQIVCLVDLLDFQRSVSAPGNVARPLEDFRRAQIAEATTIVLNKCDLAGDPECLAATRALRKLNAAAPIIQTAYGEIAPELIFRPPTVSPVSEPPDASFDAAALESAVFRAFRPFHPQRFWDWFNDSHPGLLRVKGITWLATRSLLVGGISRTAWQNGCGAAGIWWAALPREDWPENPTALQQVMRNWREPHGDRRQELQLIGEGSSAISAARELNRCLLTPEEFSAPDWTSYPDPFPDWDLHEEE